MTFFISNGNIKLKIIIIKAKEKKFIKKETKFAKEKEPISISNLLKDHTAWIISICTIFVVLLSNFIKLIDFIKNKYYFEKYGLNIQFYQYGEKGFLYEIAYSAILLLTFYIAIICIQKIIKDIRKLEFSISNFISLISLNIFIVFGMIAPTTITSFIISFILILIIEVFLLIFLRKLKEKSDQEIEKSVFYNFKENLIEMIIAFFTTSSLFIFSMIIYPTMFEYQPKYRIIDENKVIMYTTKDYYLTLNCEIIGDTLIIYKGTETKIRTEDVRSNLVQYKNMLLK